MGRGPSDSCLGRPGRVHPTAAALCRLLSKGVVWPGLFPLYLVHSYLCSGMLVSAKLLTLPHPCSLSLTLPPFLPQFLGLWLCPRRCALWKTTHLHFPSWRSTSSAVPRKALSTTTPSPVTMTGWPQCRHGEHRPATRYQAGGQLLPRASIHAAWLWRSLLRRWARSDGW